MRDLSFLSVSCDGLLLLPCSSFARVPSSRPRALAALRRGKPRALRAANSLSGRLFGGGKGLYPRKAIIRGMNRTGGVVALLSQFQTVLSSTPISSATCLWKSPRLSRLFRIWSPNVLSFLGYLGFAGFWPLSIRWQKGNESLSLWLPDIPPRMGEAG